MNFNPCCGFRIEVQKALKIIAVLQIVFGAIGMLGTGVLLFQHPRFGKSGSEVMDKEIDPASNHFYEGVVPFLLGSIYGIGLGVLLLVGAIKRNHRTCQIWLIGTVLKTFIQLIIVTNISIEILNGESPFHNIYGYIVEMGIDTYMMVVVFAFMDELTSDPTAAGYNV